jgi:hypothetical protein
VCGVDVNVDHQPSLGSDGFVRVASAIVWGLAIAQVCDAACFGHAFLAFSGGLVAFARRRKPAAIALLEFK